MSAPPSTPTFAWELNAIDLFHFSFPGMLEKEKIVSAADAEAN